MQALTCAWYRSRTDRPSYTLIVHRHVQHPGRRSTSAPVRPVLFGAHHHLLRPRTFSRAWAALKFRRTARLGQPGRPASNCSTSSGPGAGATVWRLLHFRSAAPTAAWWPASSASIPRARHVSRHALGGLAADRTAPAGGLVGIRFCGASPRVTGFSPAMTAPDTAPVTTPSRPTLAPICCRSPPGSSRTRPHLVDDMRPWQKPQPRRAHDTAQLAEVVAAWPQIGAPAPPPKPPRESTRSTASTCASVVSACHWSKRDRGKTRATGSPQLLKQFVKDMRHGFGPAVYRR